MADIELVIKIPEKLIDKINDENYHSVISWYATTLYCAIKNGTPLPKGHGRLIDGEVLHHKMSDWLKPQKPDEAEMVDLADIAVSTMMEIEETPTIIEADEESEGV